MKLLPWLRVRVDDLSHGPIQRSLLGRATHAKNALLAAAVLIAASSAACSGSSSDTASHDGNAGKGAATGGSGGNPSGGTGGGSGGAGTGGGIAPLPPVPGDCVQLQGTLTTIESGTYCVVGDVIIPVGTVLQIPPATTFIFMGRYHFGRDPSLPDLENVASGSISAIGTAAAPIVFRGETETTGWFGITVSYATAPVHLEYVTIRDTYKDDTTTGSRIFRQGGGLSSYQNAAGTILRHCTFTNNRAMAIAGALYINGNGVWPDEGRVEITDSVFDYNSCECAWYDGSETDLCGGGAIQFVHVGGDAALVTIERNTFRFNQALKTGEWDAYGGAIAGFDSGVILGPNNVFENNAAATRDGAIYCGVPQSPGLIIDSVDPSVVFENNTPDNGCGQ
jgi:hypothetical protein